MKKQGCPLCWEEVTKVGEDAYDFSETFRCEKCNCIFEVDTRTGLILDCKIEKKKK